jgi:hypothetical protein
MGDKNVKKIERNRDGVPCWDGDATTFTEYYELACLWEQSVPYHKRYLSAPKLINELTNTARRFVMAKEPDWVSYDGGVQVLLNHLRSSLGLPQMSEMSDYMAKYFRYSKRKRGETMNEYITRKTELYARARASLARVQERYEPKRDTSSSSMSWSHNSWRRTPAASQAASVAPEPAASAASQAGDVEEPAEESDAPDERHEAAGEPDPWANYGYWTNWQYQDWDYSDRGVWQNWNARDWSQGKMHSNFGTGYASTSATGPDLLPDFVQGWFLLQDAGLDTSEKNMVMAALKNNFATQRVAQELRNQWCDEDLRRKDQHSRGSIMMAEDDEDVEDPEADSLDFGFLISSGLSDEGLAVIEAAEDQVQEAMAAIEKNRRTLKEARARQHYVKMSRQYYKSTVKGKGRGMSTSTHREEHSGIYKCLRCGGSHKTSQCPQKEQQANIVDKDAEAPFVCYVDTPEDQACMTASTITTQEAMQQGKAVLDGGATRTLASVAAMERIMEINAASKGNDGIKSVNPQERPVFGFGNSSTDRCLSTVTLGIQAGGREGQLRVHTLDRGEGPLLFSIDALRSLGAIVDFSQDLVCFRKLDSHRVIQLERSCTGHQLLPLTEDLFSKAQSTSKPVPSLSDFL